VEMNLDLIGHCQTKKKLITTTDAQCRKGSL